jgi:EAL domain-containing protein (putative c-di-GMP-specific phosphodiesterase class I)
VSGLHLDQARQALVRTLTSLVAELGATITAEGIEAEEEAAVLLEPGVTHGQGYLFGRPVAVDALGDEPGAA